MLPTARAEPVGPCKHATTSLETHFTEGDCASFLARTFGYDAKLGSCSTFTGLWTDPDEPVVATVTGEVLVAFAGSGANGTTMHPTLRGTVCIASASADPGFEQGGPKAVHCIANLAYVGVVAGDRVVAGATVIGVAGDGSLDGLAGPHVLWQVLRDPLDGGFPRHAVPIEVRADLAGGACDGAVHAVAVDPLSTLSESAPVEADPSEDRGPERTDTDRPARPE